MIFRPKRKAKKRKPKIVISLLLGLAVGFLGLFLVPQEEPQSSYSTGAPLSPVSQDQLAAPLSHKEPGEDSEAEKEGETASLAPSAEPAPRQEPEEEWTEPWLALVIDDFGHSLAIAEEIAGLSLKATWAVLPQTAHGAAVMDLARRKGQPYIVHLPMQALVDSDGHGAYLIGVDSSPERIEGVVQGLLRDFPDAAGVNNHRGSKATESERTMDAFMASLAKTPWGFLDSRTSSKSVAFDQALKYHIPVAKNGYFIDVVMELSKMKSQFALALKGAEKRGSAVAICHARTGTLPFLRWLAQNENGPVRMVTLDEVWARSGR